jgi:hypothetical protein
VSKSLTDVEEARVEAFAGLDRKALGAYFTPVPIVRVLLDEVAPFVPTEKPTIIDPACGAGALLSAAGERWPGANLWGVELSSEVARSCRDRLPNARVVTANALRDEWQPAPGPFELWIGNPPYNGTSSLLQDKATYRRLRALLPAQLPKGTSLRDDFAFFLLLAASRLETTDGALAFITPASWLDSYLYAPMRQAMLEKLSLRSVVHLGAGIFANTRLRTCITVWTHRRSGRATYRELASASAETLHPKAPHWLFRPISDQAEILDATWRETGQPLTELVPFQFTGLKTRFDELLTDEDPKRLFERVRAFLEAAPRKLAEFALAHRVPAKTLSKLASLKASSGADVEADARFVRPFFRYAGAKHRDGIPPSAQSYCYLDRRLIPRGDHRLRGHYDPHAEPRKLIFNLRELPLAATVTDLPGCIHDHRHSRFAPLYVPQKVYEEGLESIRPGAKLGPPVLNLSAWGRDWVRSVEDPFRVFQAIAAFINSREVQEHWAPAFGPFAVIPIPKTRWPGAGG